MDETVSVILLFTGLCVPSASFANVYYFIKEKMTWDDAHMYCISEHTGFAQIHDMESVTAMMNTPTGNWGDTDKAWIGLSQNVSEWTWVDGEPATYFNWKSPPDNLDTDEFCAFITDRGYWSDANCSEKRNYICHGDGYVEGPGRVTWNDAKIKCEEMGYVLTTIPNETINSKVQNVSGTKQRWIGLSRPELWYWSEEPGESYKFMNWQNGQPDNENGAVSCAAVVLTDGTWTDEPCNATYPFFCYRENKSKKTVVRMKIKSSANLEDPACRADLLRQLRTALGNQGVTDFKLTWKKLPVKQKAVTTKDAC